MRKFFHFNPRTLHAVIKGFTLIEILAVTAITALITTFLIISFARSRVDLQRSANTLIADIRAQETKATSITEYQGIPRCGFGISYVDATSYRLYAGADASDPTISCSTENRNYDTLHDISTAIQSITGSRVKILQSFNDIFFESPHPRVYLNNTFNLGGLPEAIVLASEDIASIANCPASPEKCQYVCIYPSGKIELPNTLSCPAN